MSSIGHAEESAQLAVQLGINAEAVDPVRSTLATTVESMEFDHVTFVGPSFEEAAAVIAMLPDNLAHLLRQINGFILYDGGLHVRGVCDEPEWHSLASVLVGASALHTRYPALLSSDVPFAQDCVADQYVLRERKVHRLEAETGNLKALGLSLPEFFGAVQASPVEFLSMEPLLRYQQEGGSLQPGQVLHAYPPFCTEQAAHGVSLKAVPVSEALEFLSDFARQLSGLEPGQSFHMKVVP